MKAPKTELISRAGVYFTGYALSISGIIFRETSSSDIGIDGQIELVDKDGSATGMLAGVQIKSGDSFVDHKKRIFTFKASKEHYKYWANLTIPSIGIVFSPKLKTAAWFNLENHSKEIISNNSSSTIIQKIDISNELSIENSPCCYLINYIRNYYKRPITEEKLNNFDSLGSDNKTSNTDKIIIWKRLTAAFFSSESNPEVIYDVGYRLSWYFPVVTNEQRDFFKERLNKITIPELYNVIKGVIFAYENNCDRGFELITDLLKYKTDIIKMLSELMKSNLPTPKEILLLKDIIDCLVQDI